MRILLLLSGFMGFVMGYMQAIESSSLPQPGGQAAPPIPAASPPPGLPAAAPPVIVSPHTPQIMVAGSGGTPAMPTMAVPEAASRIMEQRKEEKESKENSENCSQQGGNNSECADQTNDFSRQPLYQIIEK